jgi:F-type H+-transporting ATPase subunit b
MMAEFFASNLANFIWSAAAFVVFVLILYRVAAKNVLAAVDARESRIAQQMKESEDAYAKARQVKEDLDRLMKGAEAKIAEMIAEGRRDADALKVKAVEAGRVEIDNTRNRALLEIEAARHAAIVQLKTAIADISIQVAEQVVREKLDATRHEALVGRAVDAFESRQKVGN